MKENDIIECINIEPLEGNNIAPPLELKEYTIKQLFTCGCGQTHVDVGLQSEVNYVECYKCRQTLPNSKEVHWCNSIRFKTN